MVGPLPVGGCIVSPVTVAVAAASQMAFMFLAARRDSKVCSVVPEGRNSSDTCRHLPSARPFARFGASMAVMVSGSSISVNRNATRRLSSFSPSPKSTPSSSPTSSSKIFSSSSFTNLMLLVIVSPDVSAPAVVGADSSNARAVSSSTAAEANAEPGVEPRYAR